MDLPKKNKIFLQLSKLFPTCFPYFAKFFGICKQRNRAVLGFFGESAAANYLRKSCGLEILVKNYKFGHKEIDLVAFDKKNDCIVFVEVKARKNDSKTGGYYAAVSLKKRKNIKIAAMHYIKSLKRSTPVSYRYDAVEVVHDDNGNVLNVSHFENVGF